MADLCASFEQAIVDVLVNKTEYAASVNKIDRVVAAGGVLANNRIRTALSSMAHSKGWQLTIPPIKLCTDNAAMIAAAGAKRFALGQRSNMDLNAAARLPLPA